VSFKQKEHPMERTTADKPFRGPHQKPFISISFQLEMIPDHIFKVYSLKNDIRHFCA
jgi:hypothetical protein